ncbi:hypothetical protein U9841_01065 [Escherichia coli]
MNQKSCDICSKLMPLKSHIHEVTILAHYFHDPYDITFSISEWLKLSCTLENVEIEPWNYSANDMLTCRPVYEKYESDRKYISEYTTHLTRFFFVSNALEETYRLIKDNYKSEMNTTGKRQINSNTIKAILLLEHIDDNCIPDYLGHYCNSITNFHELYIQKFAPRPDSFQFNYDKNHKCKGLDVIRQLRNYIAHGIFPINLNPEFTHGARTVGNLMRFLMLSTRLALIYIQIFLLNFGKEFDKKQYLHAIGYTSWIEDLNQDQEDNELELFDYDNFVPDIANIILNIPFEGQFGFKKFWDMKAT